MYNELRGPVIHVFCALSSFARRIQTSNNTRRFILEIVKVQSEIVLEHKQNCAFGCGMGFGRVGDVMRMGDVIVEAFADDDDDDGLDSRRPMVTSVSDSCEVGVESRMRKCTLQRSENCMKIFVWSLLTSCARW